MKTVTVRAATLKVATVLTVIVLRFEQVGRDRPNAGRDRVRPASASP